MKNKNIEKLRQLNTYNRVTHGFQGRMKQKKTFAPRKYDKYYNGGVDSIEHADNSNNSNNNTGNIKYEITREPPPGMSPIPKTPPGRKSITQKPQKPKKPIIQSPRAKYLNENDESEII